MSFYTNSRRICRHPPCHLFAPCDLSPRLFLFGHTSCFSCSFVAQNTLLSHMHARGGYSIFRQGKPIVCLHCIINVMSTNCCGRTTVSLPQSERLSGPTWISCTACSMWARILPDRTVFFRGVFASQQSTTCRLAVVGRSGIGEKVHRLGLWYMSLACRGEAYSTMLFNAMETVLRAQVLNFEACIS